MIQQIQKDRLLVRAKSLRNLKIGFSKDRAWVEYRHHLANSCELLANEKWNESAKELRLAMGAAENSELENTVSLIFRVLADVRSRQP